MASCLEDRGVSTSSKAGVFDEYGCRHPAVFNHNMSLLCLSAACKQSIMLIPDTSRAELGHAGTGASGNCAPRRLAVGSGAVRWVVGGGKLLCRDTRRYTPRRQYGLLQYRLRFRAMAPKRRLVDRVGWSACWGKADAFTPVPRPPPLSRSSGIDLLHARPLK